MARLRCRVVVLVCVALLMSLVLSACGSGADGQSIQRQATAAVAPVKPKLSPGVRRAGRRACVGLSSGAALKRFLARAKSAQSRSPVAARAGLIAQAARLSSSQVGSSAVALTAALYATTRPSADRASAFAGCLAGLQAHFSR